MTVLSFMNLIGCYYQEQMNPSNYKFDESEALKIITHDSVYNINSDDYYLKNDTVFATIRTKLDRQSTLETSVAIPVKEINVVEVESTNTIMAILSVIGIVIGIVLIGIFIAQPDFF